MLSDCDWTSTSHPTYNDGYTTTVNGLTLSYYKAQYTNSIMSVSSAGGHVRLYDGMVFMIEGAEVTKVVFHDAGSKKDCSMNIGGDGYSFSLGELVWEGHMNPFMCTAFKQSRFDKIDVTIAEPLPTGVGGVGSEPSFRLVYDLSGRSVGTVVPRRSGVYVVREGEKTYKTVVR